MKWVYSTPKGPVAIIEQRGYYHIVFQGEDLGSYSTPVHAADDASGGHTFMPSSGIDTGELNIPCDIGDWEQSR